jgi:hypothetical protein
VVERVYREHDVDQTGGRRDSLLGRGDEGTCIPFVGEVPGLGRERADSCVSATDATLPRVLLEVAIVVESGSEPAA